MKKLLMVLVAILTTLVQAEAVQRNKVVICDSKASIFKQLIEDYNEKPVWQGHSPLQTTDLILTVDEATGTWTLVEYGDTWACVLAVGERSSLRVVKDRMI